MLCWLYCVPLFKGLFYASGLLLIIFSLFVIKRGVYQRRCSLRKLAFMYIFLAVLKICTLDIYLLRDKILCGDGLFDLACNPTGFKVLQALGLAVLMVLWFTVWRIYKGFIAERNMVYKTAEQMRLRLLANIVMLMVGSMVILLLTPWVGYLTVGSV